MTTTIQSAQSQLAPHLYQDLLENGLTVLTKETPGTGVATVQIWVEAGSVYEKPHEAGITHLIEHLIFKGTAGRGPGEVAGTIEAVGGRINAYTSFEHTVYHATLDARHWPLALEVLADAVLGALFDQEELEREKPVIFEEIRMRKDRPELHLSQELFSQAFTIHPYRLPIIGSQESIAAISRDDILAYLERHYHPENFTIVVVGDVNAAEVQALSRKLFGQLPRRQALERQLPQEEPTQTDFRLFAEEQAINQTHLIMAFPLPAFKHPDTAALNVLGYILGQGEASRLYERLRHAKGLVYRINASLFSSRDPGLFMIMATLEAKRSREVISETMSEIVALRHFPVSAEELTRAKRNLEADFVFNLERAEGMAQVLGSFQMLTGDPREHDYLEQIRMVEAADIKRVATFYLQPARLTLGMLAPDQAKIALSREELALILQTTVASASQIPTNARKAAVSPLPTYRFQLANGIILLVQERRDVPTVAVRAVFPGGLRSETLATNGAFAFITELLPKGAGELDSRQLARAVADLAGDIDGINGKNTFGLSGDFLARFFDPGLILLRDMLQKPSFAPSEAERVRSELLANLKRQEDSLIAVSFREFNRTLFRGHPYALNTIGTADALRTLKIDELQAVYWQHARPDQLVLAVVGDVDADGVKLQVEELFGDWQSPPGLVSSPGETRLPLSPPARPETVELVREREQVHIIIGFLSATMTSPDRYALEILDQVLSGQSGRLFSELRDRQGLAYSLSSFSMLGTDTGAFGIYIGTSPDRRDKAIREIWRQIELIRNFPVSEAELERARNVLVGNYRLGMQTNGAQAMEMALNEIYGLGIDFAERYPARLEAISAADVLAVAKRYLQPERYIMVTVGGQRLTL